MPVVPLLVYGLFVYPRFPFIDHGLFGDWYAHALYGTLFLYGYLVGTDPGFWNELRRLRWPLSGLAAVAFAALLAVRQWIGDRPMKWLPYATQAVFAWYIMHQTITVALGYELGRLELGPVVEPVLVLGGTLAGCALLYEFVIRRVGVLRPLFGVPRRRSRAGERPEPAPPPAASPAARGSA